jgi:hypothetical protein
MIIPEFGVAEDNCVLSQVYEGMRVYDWRGNKIGTVEYVYRGDLYAARDAGSHGLANHATLGNHNSSLIAQLVRDIALPEQVSAVLREQLLRHGFLKINCTGLLRASRYVVPSQIDYVSGDGVILRVSRRELAKS